MADPRKEHSFRANQAALMATNSMLIEHSMLEQREKCRCYFLQVGMGIEGLNQSDSL